MARPPRNIWKAIVINFVDSLRPRQIRGTLIGTDILGNKYYEIPPNPQRGKRSPSRWFKPVIKEDFAQDLPAEWHSWLRGTRKLPPTEAEIAENARIRLLKKANADKLFLERLENGTAPPLPEPAKKGMESFPSYGGEFELQPGWKPK